jgi:hypothetical protein
LSFKYQIRKIFLFNPVRLELTLLGNFLIALTLLALIVIGVPNIAVLEDISRYANLHLILEAFSLLAATVLILACLAWGKKNGNSVVMILGAGFLAVALIDTAHTLSYAGMGDFVTPSGPEKAINFWLMARLIGAVTLLLVAFIKPKRLGFLNGSLIYLFALGIAGLALWAGLIHQDYFPRTFIEGQGLTGFKIGAEIFIALLYLAACIRFSIASGFKERRQTPHGDLTGIAHDRRGPLNNNLMAAAAWIFVLAEGFFCIYTSVNDVMNMAGHIYKIIGFVVLAAAVRLTPR